MKNVLILADGSVAKHFVDWISKKRVAENNYYVTCYQSDTVPEKMGQNITVLKIDPTSYARLNRVMHEVRFSIVYVVLKNIQDAQYALENIHMIDKKMRVILLHQWGDEKINYKLEHVTVIDSDNLLAAHLYDHLPNVPVVAQNVGLGQGEIMEIHVPFGSSFAYRHVGSVLQRKWKIVAIYRKEKQIIPTHATMIRPDDTLLVLGKPIVLNGLYKTINKRRGLFPEPFGKNLYLILDFAVDRENAMIYLKESIYLLQQLEHKQLFVRILNHGDFEMLEQIREYESENVTILVCYDVHKYQHTIEYDIHKYDIGLVLNSIERFENDKLKKLLYDLRKIVYLFGNEPLYNVKESVVLMGEKEQMESISSSAFEISELLKLKLCLCDFDPEGDFASKKIIIEHYEILTQILNTEINIVQKIANPVRELEKRQDLLQIAPFEANLNANSFVKYISTKIQDFLLVTHVHPKLLVPYAVNDQQ
ncbi:MAG: TrkA C-terminal domain-containing protein [Sulfurimonas sp.]